MTLRQLVVVEITVALDSGLTVHKKGQQDCNLVDYAGYLEGSLEGVSELLESLVHQSCIVVGCGFLVHMGMVFETCMHSSGVHFDHNDNKPVLPSVF